jgi:L-lactate dehydrogenase complex protein LldF
MRGRNFRARIRRSIADQDLQIALDGNALRRTTGRLQALASLPDYEQRRQRAHAIKAEVIHHLDEYIIEFISKVTANGIRVHRANSAKEAIQIFLEIARTNDAHLVAKSKSMVSEEINFNHALQAAGIKVVETDLGEYIVQLRGERPSHILTPAVHLRRGQVGQLFHEKLGTPYTEDIPEMVATARRVLREVFLTADIGVSGVNFGVAETGTLCLVTNEGNGRMVTSLPPIHVALMGMERLVPTMQDLALFLSLLPRYGTGQKLSSYTSLIRAPKSHQDMEGPAERHLILLDNGRSTLSKSPLSESLFCIRCGSCLNACPVFREIGGHAYVGVDGSIAPYPGPIGSVISPGLLGCDNFGQLAQASTLCGACREACPVNIDLPELLLRVRAGDADNPQKIRKEQGLAVPGIIKMGLKAFRVAAGTSNHFSLAQRLGSLASWIYSPNLKYMHLPAWTGWGYSKDFPRLEMKPFRTRWKTINQNVNTGSPIPTPLAQSGVPASLADLPLADRFTQEATVLGVKCFRLPEKEVQARLADLFRERGVDRVCGDEIGEKYVHPLPFILGSDPSIRVGVTGALAGIADTGSLVLFGRAGHPLTPSLLPDIHIAILKVSDLVPSLSDIFLKPEILTATSGVIITGPSRTGDIEMTLSIGVHGPKEVLVFLID